MTGSAAPPAAPIEAIHRQVMWDRLIAVVEEQAQTILRTAFGSVVREAGDLSAGIYDLEGRMIAQAVTGTPGHVNTMARAVEHFLARFPVAAMHPGDVFVTNDPWLGTGHLFDFVVVSPACLDTRPVALLASTCHVIDVGGRGFSAEAKSVHEEGVLIPHMKLRDRGALNDDLMTILLANTRNPVEVRGDLLSLVSCNDTGAERLRDMMAEFDLRSIDSLADHVIATSRDAMRRAIRSVPNGRYRTRMELDGYDEPVFIKAEMTVADEDLVIDYGGTSRASAYGINSPLCYTEAYTCFGLKCIVAPGVPNNHGSLSVFRTVAEPGSAVHPVHPSPVTARHVIGQMLPDVAFGCLAQALPGKIPAESAGSIWVLPFANGGPEAGTTGGANASRFNVMNVGMGGIGARPRQGRPVGDRVPERGRGHSRRGDGVGVPARLLAQGAPSRFGRGRRVSRRARAGHRGRQHGESSVHDLRRDLRPHAQPAAGPRRRALGTKRRRPSRVGDPLRRQGGPHRAGRGSADRGASRGRRARGPPAAGGGSRARRPRGGLRLRGGGEAGLRLRVAVDDGRAHICSAAVARPAGAALDFLADPRKLSSWAAGMGATTVHPGGTVEGAFPGTNRPVWARIDADRRRSTVHYHLGPDPGSLVPRIMVSVVPGEVLDADPETCVVSLIAWRQETMDDARWAGLKSGHEREIREIKRLLESTGRQ